jgi:DNA-binding beta-propeller fold protein YncE
MTTTASNIAMSPAGSRLAVIEENAISVFDVLSGRLLASTTTDPARHYLRMVFLTEQTLRIYGMDPLPPSATIDEAPGPGLASIGIVDFQIDARKLKETATIENLRRTFSLAFNDLGERLIVWEKAGQVSLFDASTGRRLATLGPGGWDAGSRGAFLSDGRPVLAESAAGNGRVHLFSKEGREERVFDLGRAGVVQLGGEPVPGQIALAIGAAKESGVSDALLLDLNSGAVRKLGAHLFPIAAHMRWRLPMPEPGSEATRLFARADGSVVRLDPQTGALATILPKR